MTRRNVISFLLAYGGALALAAALSASDERGQTTIVAGLMLFAVSFSLFTYLLRLRGPSTG